MQSTDAMCSQQIIDGIFHRTRTKNFTIHMEIQRLQMTKAVLRKNGAEGINLLTSDYTTKLQSLRQYGTDTKTEI